MGHIESISQTVSFKLVGGIDIEGPSDAVSLVVVMVNEAGPGSRGPPR